MPEQHVRLGAANVYARFNGYVPPPTDTPAGPKPVHFDRVEWAYIPDPATVTNAMINGEAAWQEYVYADQLPLLRRARNVEVTVKDQTGFVNMLRLNELQKPFDNRRSVARCGRRSIRPPSCRPSSAPRTTR